MAFTKKEKEQMLSRYEEWLNKSQAVVLLEYKNMTMKDINGLRAKLRDSGSEVHVVKNTLWSRALENAGIKAGDGVSEGPIAVSFAFNDPPGVAKILSDSTAKSEIFKIKGGFLGKQAMTQAEVKSLAELPPLPVLRARLLGVLQAPAAQLVRTVNEPGRSLAAVVKAYADKQTPEAASAAAE